MGRSSTDDTERSNLDCDDEDENSKLSQSFIDKMYK